MPQPGDDILGIFTRPEEAPTPHCDAVADSCDGQPLLRPGQDRTIQDLEDSAESIKWACLVGAAVALLAYLMSGPHTWAGM